MRLANMSVLGAVLVVTLVALVLVSPAAAIMASYTFEGLTTGQALAGQDNWAIANPHTGGSYNGGWVGTGSGVNGTTVAGASASGNDAMSRINNGNWSYAINFSDTSYAYCHRALKTGQ